MAISGLVLLLMMFLVSADVFAATFLGKPLQNVIEIVAYYMMVGIVFLPLGSAELRDEHIKTDIFTQILPRKLWLVTQTLVGLAGAGMLGLLLYVSFDKAVQATTRGEMMMGTTMIDIWPSRWIVVFGIAFFLICLIFATARQLFQAPEPDGRPADRIEGGL
ncbi:TRAP transporter small permease subunit [Roseovarius sp. D0-M9]|uniref:TRAP transporter small permease subunit n=1 Tax=Roseovarius sp. D0-M9 TaxID=3127117 RepID=UPI00300FB38B